MDFSTQAIDFHRKLKGKIEVKSKVKLDSIETLGLAYTPGVAKPVEEIAKNPDLVREYTMKGNCVAVVTDGSAVLGLGNVGAEAAIPVMEGKALLFKELAGIDAFPICIKTQNAKEIESIVRNIAPVFGAINLEDISAPRCFEIESNLEDVGIPVMHDDQHGTAIVVSAALKNACKVVGKDFEDLNVVVSGSGAAGIAIARMLLCIGYEKDCARVQNLVLSDSRGIVSQERSDLNLHKASIAKLTNHKKINGSLEKALAGADVFIGVSAPGIVTKQMVRSMNSDAIVFAMANPTPEIMPGDAIAAGARVVATGRSDFPNQVNNALAFPGVFRGALDAKAKKITNGMKAAASAALASCIKHPSEEKIIPAVLDRTVVSVVSQAVKHAATA